MPFKTTQKRFNYSAKDILPGPGQYLNSEMGAKRTYNILFAEI